MILHGNQRAGACDLARHLLNNENEQVDVHELRGFIAEDLSSAFQEIHAVAKGTRAKQYLFSLSLNPPKNEHVSTRDFERAINHAEKLLNLNGQPRAVVFHVKNHRRHCHVVWSRINEQTMKAIPLPHTKRKLTSLSKDLYLHHGWQMPKGFLNAQEKNPLNFNLAQWQQAKRIGKDPRKLKETLQNCWINNDGQVAFIHALKDQGYRVAKGDRRSIVVVDQYCEVYALNRWIGIKLKAVKEKLSNLDNIPSVHEVRQNVAQEMIMNLNAAQQITQQKIQQRKDILHQHKRALAEEHEQIRRMLQQNQESRWAKETQQRQARFRTGLRGFFDRFTGRHKNIKRLNEQEALQAHNRDQKERDALIFQQIDSQKKLQARLERLGKYQDHHYKMLHRDVQQYEGIQQERGEFLERDIVNEKSRPNFSSKDVELKL